MDKLTDKEIIEELHKRLQAKDKANNDLLVVTKKLETMNAKLLESEKLKSHFLSNIRNEINNPLTSVLTSCQLVVTDDGSLDTETIKLVVSTIYKEAFSLSFQLHNIFAAAELEAGDPSFSVSTVEVRSLVKGVVDSFHHRAAEKKLTVAVEGQDVVFSTDPEKLELVVSNLLCNAIEYSPEGKHIEINLKRDALERLIVSVKDGGIGIDKANHDVIFERFKQIDTGVTKSHLGHGLGLSIVKAIVDLMYGAITVDSAKGAGATFTLTLPESKSDGMPGAFSSDGNEFFFKDGVESEKF